MPMHDWTLVEAGIFHAFHHRWISAISDALNLSVLPKDYYALPEQVAAGFGPDVLALQDQRPDDEDRPGGGSVATVNGLQTRPRTRIISEAEIYRREKSAIAVHHVSGDRLVAMIEIVSPGNKGSRNALRSLVDKAWELLDHRIHLFFVDPFPPGPRDPNGIHGAIWSEFTDEEFVL